MCTVTLIPKGKHFILTSNRDEQINRKTLPVDFYSVANTQMIYPKDTLAGGTWIAFSENKQMICLLNGGFKNHEKQYAYRHSRGVVVTDILGSGTDLEKSLQAYNYTDLEPFTLVAVDWSNSSLSFFELVWDGTNKHFKKLDNSISHIWSSSTLYDTAMKGKRKDWFNDFKLNNELNPESLLKFHKTGGVGNEFYDLIIKRGDLQTRSITQVRFQEDQPLMRYEDLISNQVFEKQFEIINI